MSTYLNIQTCFTSSEDRTLSHLVKIYSNPNALKEQLYEIINPYLSLDFMKGKRILLKPNWVKHDTKASDALCLRTNVQFIIATLDLLLERKPAEVLIGDAPIQGCDWDRMMTPSVLDSFEKIRKKHGIPVKIKDFRRVTFNSSKNDLMMERSPMSDYVIFDLGEESYLEPITKKNRNQFRVTDYNPDCLTKSHNTGVHKYCIAKDLFRADIVISLPKIKTHQKTGLTAALKNMVGINGDKDFLPHHQIGGTKLGGDCYPGGNYLRYCSELVLDSANRRRGQGSYLVLRKIAGILWKLSCPGNEHQLAAGWHGNDTTWRMVFDINKIISHGKIDGSLSPRPQRQIFSLCDGIIGGQGNGPLEPEPLPLGIVSFSNHSFLTDVAIGRLMGFDIFKIPLLSAALAMLDPLEAEITLNSQRIQLDDLDEYAIKAIAPPGWIKCLDQ